MQARGRTLGTVNKKLSWINSFGVISHEICMRLGRKSSGRSTCKKHCVCAEYQSKCGRMKGNSFFFQFVCTISAWLNYQHHWTRWKIPGGFFQWISSPSHFKLKNNLDFNFLSTSYCFKKPKCYLKTKEITAPLPTAKACHTWYSQYTTQNKKFVKTLSQQ